MMDALDALMANIANIESGGNYGSQGPVTQSGDRAYGKYQVMGQNVPAWTREVLGYAMTPSQFLGDPKAQETVARAKLGQYLSQSGDPRDAASMWFTGRPLAQGARLSDVNGTTGARYAALAANGVPFPQADMSLLEGPVGGAPVAQGAGDALSRLAAAQSVADAIVPKNGKPGQSEDVLSQWAKSVAPQSAAQPASLATSAPDQSFRPPPSVPFQTSPNAVANPPSNVVDPSEPIGQQIKTAGGNALSYWGPQVSGIPGAIAGDYRAATALNEQGNRELNSGNVMDAFPSFPSSDPRTWTGGGLLHALGGMAGQISAPVTGAVRQLVEQPVTEATGNPEAGARAGFVANALAPAMGADLLGRAGGAMASRVAGLDPETARLAQLATEKYGIPLTAPQMSADNGLKVAASTLDRLPLSGAAKFKGEQQGAFNRAVAATIGENADSLTPEVMARAKARIGGVFDDVADKTTIRADSDFQNELQDAIISAHGEIPQSDWGKIDTAFSDIVGKIGPDGTIDGKAYQGLTAKNSPLGRAMNSDNGYVAHWASQIKDTLDDALERSAPPDLVNDLRTAKYQYRNLKTIEPLAAKAPTGDVSPALLAGRINAATGNSLAYGGGGELGDLARIGQKFLKEPGSSNTAERSLTMLGLAKAAAIPGAIPSALFAGEHFGLLGGVSPGMAAASALTAPAFLGMGRALGAAGRSQWLANALINRTLNPAVGGLSPALSAVGGSAGLVNEPVNALTSRNQ